VEELDADFAALVASVNARVAGTGLPPLPAALGWAQKGPLARKSTAGSRHNAKFEACRRPCLAALDRYYAADFALFGYPRVGNATVPA